MAITAGVMPVIRMGPDLRHDFGTAGAGDSFMHTSPQVFHRSLASWQCLMQYHGVTIKRLIEG